MIPASIFHNEWLRDISDDVLLSGDLLMKEFYVTWTLINSCHTVMGWRRRSSIDKQKHQQVLVQPHSQQPVKQTVEQTTQTQPQKQSVHVQVHPHKHSGYHSKLRAIIERNCNNNTVQVRRRICFVLYFLANLIK